MTGDEVRIEEARTDAEVDRALAVAEQVWGQPPVSQPIARAMSFAGWYVSLASAGAETVGMCAGFVGLHGDDLHLHSHLAAVVPGWQGRGIGRALKQHQRRWCLDHGIGTVTWTFDPLVRENARFNLHHLGVVGDRYLVDLYGPMDDEINHGHPTDRLLVRWDLTGEAPTQAADDPQGASRAVSDVDGAPVVGDRGGDVRLVATPRAIVELRRSRPDLALAWRLAVREAMTAAFDVGLRPVAMTDDGSYLLSRGRS